jgi:adhesin/invasin
MKSRHSGPWLTGWAGAVFTLLALVSLGGCKSQAQAGVAAKLVLVSGDAQSAVVGTAVANPLVVKATDTKGVGVAGIKVTWATVTGGGSIAATSATGADGTASAVPTMGPATGANSFTATVAGAAGSPVKFSAAGTPDLTPILVIAAGEGQAGIIGTPLPNQLRVKAIDSQGGPLAGAVITWSVASGGGSVSPATSTTGIDGTAGTIAALGGFVGQNSYTASTPGFHGSPATFHATSTAGATPTLLVASGEGQSASVGTSLTRKFIVKAVNSSGIPVPGITVAWAAASGGGSILPASGTTGADGTTGAVATLGPAVGSNSFTAADMAFAAVPATFSAVAIPAPSATIILVAGEAQTGAVGTPLDNPLIVKAIDSNGAPVPGVQVTWTAATGGGSIAPFGMPPSTSTGADGTASATATLGPASGPNTFTATAPGFTLSAVTFNATATDAATSFLLIVSGDGQSGVAGRALATPLVVKALDSGGGVVSGITVSFSVAVGGGQITPDHVKTGSDGTASATATLGQSAGPNSFLATSKDFAALPAVFSATATPAPIANASLVSGNNQTALVGMPLPMPLVVKATNAQGAPVAGIQISWAVETGGGRITPALVSTGADGTASATVTLGPAAGANTFTAAGPLGAAVTFAAAGTAVPVPTLMLVSGDGQSGPVGAQLMSKLVVKALDIHGRPVVGQVISWAVVTGDGTVLSPATMTGIDGNASTLAILGPEVGANSYSASAAGYGGSPVTFEANAHSGPTATVTMDSGQGQSAPVGYILGSNLVIKATAADGSPTPGVLVTWAAATGGSVTPATSMTGADGTASTSATLGGALGENTFTATTGADFAGSPVTFHATGTASPAATPSLISGNGQTSIAGTPLPNQLVVKATDNSGAPMAGVQITWLAATGGGSLATPFGVTGANGIASTFATLGGPIGPNRFTAHISGVPGSLVSFNASGTVGPPALLAIASGNAQSRVVGSDLLNPLVVKATDAHGNAVVGVDVTWAVTSGGGTVTVASTPSAVDGSASATARLGTAIGVNRFTATGTGLTTPPVTFFAIASSGAVAGLALASGNGQTGVAGQPLKTKLVVRATDVYGNATPGVPVSWAVTSGGGRFATASGLTGADGSAAATPILGGGLGANSFTATLPSLPNVSVTFSATANVGSPTNMVLVSGDGQTALTGTPLTNPLVVKVTDANGNPAQGVQIAWAAATGGGSVTAVTNPTGSDGIASASAIAGATMLANTFTASVGGLIGSPVTFSATGTPHPATSLGSFSGDMQSGVAGTLLAAPLVVKARDAQGRPAAGVKIIWASATGGGVVTSVGGATAGDGTAFATVTLGNVVGPNSYTATFAGLATAPVVFSSTGVAGAAVSFTLVSGDAQSGPAGGTLANPLVVRAADVNGNSVAGTPVTWAVTGGGGKVTTPAGNTGADGTASTTVTLGSAGANAFTATTTAVAGSLATFSATGVNITPLAPIAGGWQWQGQQAKFAWGSQSCTSRVALAVGESSVCYEAADDTLKCAGTIDLRTYGAAFAATGMAGVDQILNSGTGSGLCVHKTDGTAWCMGNTNAGGQFGDGTLSESPTFVQWGRPNLVAIGTGNWGEICALDKAGTVACAGNTYGATPVVQGSMGPHTSFWLNSSEVLAIDDISLLRAGDGQSSCTVSTSGLSCGLSTVGSPGQVVSGGEVSRLPDPTLIDGSTCANLPSTPPCWLDTSGTVQCEVCVMGVGSAASFFTPGAVLALAVNSQSDALCAVYQDASLWCISNNNTQGMIGAGDTGPHPMAVRVQPPGSVLINCQ